MAFVFLILLIVGLFYLYWHLSIRSHRYFPILAYHKITNRFEWGITRVSPENFERQVSYLKQEGYSDHDLSELITGVEIELPSYGGDRESRPSNQQKKQVAITFDDGYESVYQNAFPVLKRYGFSATVFLISGYIGKENLWEATFGCRFKHMNWEQISEMKNCGFKFGSHTVNHPDLTRLSKKDLEYELKKSKEVLENNLNQKIEFLSYPFGRHNKLVRKETKKAGYKAAFSLIPNKPFDLFAAGRIGIYLHDTPLSLGIKLKGKGLFRIEEYKGWLINQFSAGTVLVKKYKDVAEVFRPPQI